MSGWIAVFALPFAAVLVVNLVMTLIADGLYDMLRNFLPGLMDKLS